MELLNTVRCFGTLHITVLPGHHVVCRFLGYRGIGATIEEAFFNAADHYLEQMMF